MSREKEYYTPDIEDIFVGYECELPVDGNWNKIAIMIGDFYTIDYDQLRTPYLTKEQIEGEGWSNPEVYRDGGTLLYKQEGYELTFKGENNLARSRQIKVEKVWKTMEGNRLSLCLFLGECPSINEFRKICKLLNI